MDAPFCRLDSLRAATTCQSFKDLETHKISKSEVRLVLLADPVSKTCMAVDGSLNEADRLLRVKVQNMEKREDISSSSARSPNRPRRRPSLRVSASSTLTAVCGLSVEHFQVASCWPASARSSPPLVTRRRSSPTCTPSDSPRCETVSSGRLTRGGGPSSFSPLVQISLVRLVQFFNAPPLPHPLINSLVYIFMVASTAHVSLWYEPRPAT